MTTGHKHRTIKVRSRLGLRLVAVLKYPLFITTNLDRVDRSSYPYGPMKPSTTLSGRPVAPRPEEWYLSALGILHRWTGLTFDVP